jgi:hypothetical protein
MTSARDFARVFHGAAQGCEEFSYGGPIRQNEGMRICHVSPAMEQASVMAAAFRGIADVFEKIAETEENST